MSGEQLSAKDLNKISDLSTFSKSLSSVKKTFLSSASLILVEILFTLYLFWVREVV